MMANVIFFFFLLSFFDIQHIVECQNYLDFRFSIFIMMANVKICFAFRFPIFEIEYRKGKTKI